MTFPERPRAGALLAALAGPLLLCLWLPAMSAQLSLDGVLGDLSGAEGEEWRFARAETVRPFVFPADHGPHERFRSEWWYLTVNLENPDCAHFGVQFTAFRQALRADGVGTSPWASNQVYLAHLAVTDVDGARHLAAERLARGHPRLAGAQGNPFRVWVDGWSLSADAAAVGDSGPMPPFQLTGRTEGFAVQLRLTPMKPLVLQGDRGLSRKGPQQASYYYSVPRLAASGLLQLGGQTHEVAGEGWLDREWSSHLLASHQRGWDWYGLQLDGGEELMVFQLRRHDGARDAYDQGLWVNAAGRSRWLKVTDFDLHPLRYWRDGSGAAWPVAWRLDLRLPGGNRRYQVGVTRRVGVEHAQQQDG